MKHNCEKCDLPNINDVIRANRSGAEIAQANISGSDSPTEAKPYIEQKTQCLASLSQAIKKRVDFLNLWSEICLNCPHRTSTSE